ncbi:MAG: hypothetical protein SF069_18985 [Phycisphaerae bacterium]|nr:hypothetical protein [Phycisphaerae bacterium]
MAERSEPISFRLPAPYAKELMQRAADQGESVGEHARRIVIDSLTDAATQELREELGELRKLVTAVREDFATAVVALLTQKSPYSREDAEAWVKKTFFR